jgi:hypothetical protein
MIFETSPPAVGLARFGTSLDQGRRVLVGQAKDPDCRRRALGGLDMEWVVLTLGHEVVGPAATAQKAIESPGERLIVLMDIRLATQRRRCRRHRIRQRFDIQACSSALMAIR